MEKTCLGMLQVCAQSKLLRLGSDEWTKHLHKNMKSTFLKLWMLGVAAFKQKLQKFLPVIISFLI